jgi:hypothetical protein
MCCIIANLFLGVYVMLACSYTLESFLNKKLFTKYWYAVPFVILWCIITCLIYFPCDLGAKLYKKLNDTKN